MLGSSGGGQVSCRYISLIVPRLFSSSPDWTSSSTLMWTVRATQPAYPCKFYLQMSDPKIAGMGTPSEFPSPPSLSSFFSPFSLLPVHHELLLCHPACSVARSTEGMGGKRTTPERLCWATGPPGSREWWGRPISTPRCYRTAFVCAFAC